MCLFFFFKQKTAYEMRISDWSSDVCSSDLGTNHEVERQPAVGGGEDGERRQQAAKQGEGRQGGGGDLGRGQHVTGVSGSHGVVGGRAAADRGPCLPGAIGRTSCRERVCPSGVELGGRRIINKKKTLQ